jgi:hypothetical protein
VAAPIVGGISGAIGSMASGTANAGRTAFGRSETGMQNFAAQVAAAAHARGSSQSTAPLNPFNGQPPGYNLPGPSGPALPPGNGSGGAGWSTTRVGRALKHGPKQWTLQSCRRVNGAFIIIAMLLIAKNRAPSRTAPCGRIAEAV